MMRDKFRHVSRKTIISIHVHVQLANDPSGSEGKQCEGNFLAGSSALPPSEKRNEAAERARSPSALPIEIIAIAVRTERSGNVLGGIISKVRARSRRRAENRFANEGAKDAGLFISLEKYMRADFRFERTELTLPHSLPPSLPFRSTPPDWRSWARSFFPSIAIALISASIARVIGALWRCSEAWISIGYRSFEGRSPPRDGKPIASRKKKSHGRDSETASRLSPRRLTHHRVFTARVWLHADTFTLRNFIHGV